VARGVEQAVLVMAFAARKLSQQHDVFSILIANQYISDPP
jgi:hypothetical protein